MEEAASNRLAASIISLRRSDGVTISWNPEVEVPLWPVLVSIWPFSTSSGLGGRGEVGAVGMVETAGALPGQQNSQMAFKSSSDGRAG